MKTSLEIIKAFVVWLELFSKENPENEVSLESFILWLNSKLFSADHIDESEHKSETLNMELSFLLVLQNRYYKAYAKESIGSVRVIIP